MSVVDVFDNNALKVDYPEPDMVAQFSAVAANSVTAYKDLTGESRDLLLGASSNVQIEALNTINMYAGDNGTMSLYKTTVEDSNVRIDTLVLNVQESETGVTRVTAGSNALVFVPGDSNLTTVLGSLTIQDDVEAGHLILSTGTMSNALRIANSLHVDGAIFQNTVTIGGDLLSMGKVFGQNFNLFKNESLATSNATRVGYTLNINEKDQLEVIKYCSFGDKAVYKRVAVFGTQNLAPDDPTDTTYDGFDMLP